MEKLSLEKEVYKVGNAVIKPKMPWTESIHNYLNFLVNSGFNEVPKIIGLDESGNELLEFIESEYIHPKPWNDALIKQIGNKLRELHEISKNYKYSRNDKWQNWFLHNIGDTKKIISHCDIAPWNVITKGNTIIGIIDWEYVGPVDPIMELARVCWLFIQLYDDDVGEKIGLPDLTTRAHQLRILLDSYKLRKSQRKSIIDRIIEVGIYETAQQAIDENVEENTIGKMWGISWRARSIKWIVENKEKLRDIALK